MSAGRCDLYPPEVKAKIDELEAAGFHEQVSMFDTLYAAWYRTTSAYRVALPFVDDRTQCISGEVALHVVTATINIWAEHVPGTPVPDNEAVRKEVLADAKWHEDEARAMARAARNDDN